MRLACLTPCLLLLLSTEIEMVDGIRCFVCESSDRHVCDPLELYGNKTECPSDVHTCYKSWSVEADPETVRKCDLPHKSADKGDRCAEKLDGANKKMVCRCDTDLCNNANLVMNFFAIFFRGNKFNMAPLVLTVTSWTCSKLLRLL